jgi:glucan biosynthesis protein C
MGKRARTKARSGRRYDLDWLRVIGTLLIFAYHSAAPFHPWFDWHIRSVEKSELLGWFTAAAYSWPLPLFMLLAGAGSWYAFRKRSYRQYAGERFMRLFVPFLVGIIILIPPQVYFERAQRWQFRGSFLQFLPHAFEGGPYPAGNISAGQLWFLAYLFVYSLLALPLIRFLRSDIGRRWTSRLAAFCQRRGAIFLFSIPLVVGQLALGWRYPETHNPVNDWMFHWVLFWVFVFGYILFSDQRFQQAIDREWIPALALAIATSVGMLALLELNPRAMDAVLGHGSGYAFRTTESTALYVLGSTALRVNTWAWLVLILGLAHRFLSFTSRLLSYTSRSSGTVYVFHQTVIIAVAFYAVRWKTGMTLKFLTIFLVSLALTMALYELARRWIVTRFLFGLKAPGKPPRAPAGEKHSQAS